MTTPQQYIDGLDEPRRTEIGKLFRHIRETVPQLKPHSDGKGIGFGTYRYRYASGRTGEAAVIGLVSRKQYISVYVSGWEDGQGPVTARFADRLGKADVGKSCIRFKHPADIDLDVLAQTIRAGAKALAGQTV
jgi:hypothetical protein